MGALSIPEPTGLRYALYIQELREFFAFSGLAYGSPDDVFAVIERIQNNPSFAEDLSSLVRAAILREGGSMPHGQLLEILAIAVGGPAMEHAPQTHRTPLRQLLSFLTGVLRRPWNLPPGERAEVLPFPTEFPTASPEATPLATALPETPAPQAAAPVPTAPAIAPPLVATNLATALLKATTLEAASPETPFPATAPLPTPPPEIALPDVARLETAPLAITPLEAIAFDPPEPPPQLPAPELEVHPEPPAPMPVLATVVQPEPAQLELQQPELSNPHPSPLTAPPDAQPDPIPALAKLLEPPSGPASALGLEPPPDQEAAEASPSAADQAEDRAPTFAPWVVPQRSPRPMNPQPRRMAWIYRPMREIAAVGVCALLIAGLVAVALRPGSSLSSEAQPAPAPSPSRNSSPAPLPVSPAPAPVATLPAPSVPPAAEPVPPNPVQPTPSQTPSSGSHPLASASAPATATPQKPHTGVSDRDYIAPPTAHYYNGWGPANQTAATKPASPASAPSAAAPVTASAAANTKSEQSYGPYQPAAPIERRPGAASFVTPGDIPSAPHLFALSSSALAPNLISAPFPEYPRMARLAHVQGPVVVEALIDKDGTVTVTRVVSGHRLLRGAAVSAVQRWLYRPYRVDGHPVQVSTTLTITVAPRLTTSY
jgi:TonB family protein